MLLLASIITLFGATLFWRLYDPTITDLISLSITTTNQTNTPRIQSGDTITHTIAYQNNSDIAIEQVVVSVNLPPGFQVQATSENVAETIQQTQLRFSLGTLEPDEAGSLTLTGRLFGVPDDHIPTTVIFSYQQQNETRPEEKIVRTLTTLRGSVLQLSIDSPETVINQTASPLIFTLTNTSDVPIENITLPIPTTKKQSIVITTSTTGYVTNNTWNVPTVSPNTSTTLIATFTPDLSDTIDTTDISLTPLITVNGFAFSQVPVTHAYTLVTPRADLSIHWPEDRIGLSPGESYPVVISIKNTGSIDLEHLTLSLPLPEAIINTTAFQTQNKLAVKKGIAILSEQTTSAFRLLRVDESLSFTVSLPIDQFPTGGTDLTLSLAANLNATPLGVHDQTYRITGSSASIRIGTALSLTAQARYYTNEGDQLGRGPLPPMVGKETKYWALLTVKNNTSSISPLTVTASLPPHITWTGKSSVTHGKDVSYNPTTRTATWSVHTLHAHETAQAGFELSFTPNSDQVGSTPLLLTNIKATATDTFIDTNLTASAGTIDTSLTWDSIAQAKGTKVK